MLHILRFLQCVISIVQILCFVCLDQQLFSILWNKGAICFLKSCSVEK